MHRGGAAVSDSEDTDDLGPVLNGLCRKMRTCVSVHSAMARCGASRRKTLTVIVVEHAYGRDVA